MSYRSGGYTSGRLGGGAGSSYSSKYSTGSAAARSSSAGASSYSSSKYDSGNSYTSRYSSSKNDSKPGGSYTSKYTSGSAAALGKDSADTYSSKYRRDSSAAGAADAYGSTRRTSADTSSSKYLDTDSFASKYRRGSDTLAPDTDYSSRYRRGSDVRAGDEDSYASKYRRGSDSKTADTDAYSSKYGREGADRYSSRYDAKGDSTDKYTSKYRSSLEPESRTSRYDTKAGDTDSYASKYRRDSGDRPSSRYSDLKADTDYASRYRSASPSRTETKASDTSSSRYRRDSADRTDSRLSAADSHSSRYGVDSRLSNRSADDGSDRPSSRYGSRLDDGDAYKSSYRRSSIEPDGRSGRTSPYTTLDDRHRSGRASPYLGETLASPYRRGSREGSATDYMDRRRSSRDTSPFNRDRDNASPFGRDRDREAYRSRYSPEPPDKTADIIAKYKNAKDDLTAEIDTMIKQNRRKEMEKEMSQWQQKTADLLTEKPKPKEPRTRSGSRPKSRASDSDDSKRKKIVRRKPRASSEDIEPVTTKFKVKDDLGDEIDALIRQNRRKAIEDDIQHKLAAMEDAVKPGTTTVKKHSDKRRSHSPRHADYDYDEPFKRRGRRTALDDDEPSGSRRRRHEYDDEADVDEPRTLLRSASKADDAFDEIEALREKRRKAIQDALKSSEEVFTDTAPRAVEKRRSLSREPLQAADKGFAKLDAQKQKRRKALEQALRDSEQAFDQATDSVARQLSDARRSAEPTKNTRANNDSSPLPARSASQTAVPRKIAELAIEEADRPKRFSWDSLKKTDARRRPEPEEHTKEDFRAAADRLKRVKAGSARHDEDEQSNEYLSHLRKVDTGSKHAPYSTATDAYAIDETVPLPKKSPVDVNIPEKRGKTQLEKYERYTSSESEDETPSRRAAPKDDGFDEIEALRQKRRQAIEEALRESADVFDKTAEAAVKKPSDARRSASPAKRVQPKSGDTPQRSASQAAVPRRPVEQNDAARPSRVDGASKDDVKDATERPRRTDGEAGRSPKETGMGYPSDLKKADLDIKEAPFSTATDSYAVNETLTLPSKAPFEAKIPEKRGKTQLEQYESYSSSEPEVDDIPQRRVKPGDDAGKKSSSDTRLSESPDKKVQATYDDVSATQAASSRTPTETSRRGVDGTSANDGAPHDDLKGAGERLRHSDIKPERPTEKSRPDYSSRLRKTDIEDKEEPFSTTTDAFAVNETVSLPSKKPFEVTIPEKRGKTHLEQYERYSSSESETDDLPQSRVKPNEDAAKKISFDPRRSESPAKKVQPTYDDVSDNQAASPRTPTRTPRRDVDATSANDRAPHDDLKGAAERLSHSDIKSERPTERSHLDNSSRLRKNDLDDKEEPLNTATDAYSVNETVSLLSKMPAEAGIPEIQEKTNLERYKRFSSSESDEEPPRRSAPPKDDGFDEIEALRQKRRKAIEDALRASEEVFDKTADVAVKKPSDARRSASPVKKTEQSADESPSVPQRSASQAAVPRKPVDASPTDNGRPSRIDSTPSRATDGKKDAVSGIAAQDDFKSAADRLKHVDAQGRSVDDEPTRDYSSQLKKTDVGKKDAPLTTATDDYSINAAFSTRNEPLDVNLPDKRDKTQIQSYEKSPASVTAKPTATTKAEPDSAKAAGGLVKEIGPDGKARWVKAGQPGAGAKPKADEAAKTPARSASQAAAPRKPAETPSTPEATPDRSASVTPKPTVPPKMAANEPGKPEKSGAEPQVSSAQKPRPASPKKTSTDKPHKEPVTGSRIKGIDQDQRGRHGPSHLAYDSEIGPYSGKQRADASEPDAMRGPTAVKDVDADEDAEYTFQPRSGDNVVSPQTAPKPAGAEKTPVRAEASDEIADEDANFTYKPRVADKSRSSSPTKKSADPDGTKTGGTRSSIKDPMKLRSNEPLTDEAVDFAFAPKDGKTPSRSDGQADRDKAPSKATQPEAQRDENSGTMSKPKPAEQAKPQSPSPAKKPITSATQPSKSQDSGKAEPTRTPVIAMSDASVPEDGAEFTFKPTTTAAGKPRSPSPSKKPTSTITQAGSVQDATQPGTTTSPPEVKPYEAADKDAEYTSQQKDDDKKVPPVAAAKQSSQQKAEPRDSLRKVEGKPKDTEQHTSPDEYAVLRKPPIEVNIPDKRDKTHLEKFAKSPYEQSKAGKPVQDAGKHSRDRSLDAAPKAAGGLVKEIGPDGKTRWVKAGAQPAKDAKSSAGKPGATPRSASAAAGPRRQLSDEELEPEEISDPNWSKEPAKHDIRFVAPQDKQKTEPQVSVAATGKPRSESPQKTAGGDKPDREPRTGSRIKGIDQDQRDRHGPDHLSYDSEIGPFTGNKKKGEPEGREHTAGGSVPTEGPLKAKPGKPVADEDADFTFKPKAHDTTDLPRATATPKDGENATPKVKPGEAVSDENADFTFAPRADDKAKPRPASSAEKPSSATAPATRPQTGDDDHREKAPLRPKPGEATADKDADFAFKPKTSDKPKSRSSSPSKKTRPITPRIVIDEPEDETDAEYLGDLKKPLDTRPNDSKPTSQPTRSQPPTSFDDEEEQEPESLDDDVVPARTHDLSFKPKPPDKPIETGKAENKAPSPRARPGEPEADEDADFTFQPTLGSRPTSKPTPTGATKPADSDEELEPELIDDASGGPKKPTHDVKFKPYEARKPDDDKKAPTNMQPEKPLTDEDFTFKPKGDDKKAPPQTSPKASKDVSPDAKRSLEDASKESPKAMPGDTVPDEDADFTFKPKPSGQEKAGSPSVTKKPSDAAGQPVAAKGEPSKTPLKPRPGDTVPDEDAEYTFQPKSTDKAPRRSPSPAKKPTGTDVQQPKSPDVGTQTKTPLKTQPGDAIPDEDADFTFKPKQGDMKKPRSPSPAKKPVASVSKPQAHSRKPQDSDEELEPELVDEGPTAKVPAHDVKLKPAETKKPANEANVPSKTVEERPTSKPDETPTGDVKVADKTKPRSPIPAKKPVGTSGQPKAAVSLKPADSEEELEPELVDSGPLRKKPDHDVKLKPAEATKPVANEKVPPKTADKPAGRPCVSPQGMPTTNARPTLEGNAPDEDADFSFKPKAADKAKSRSPSPTKKPVSPKAAGKRPVDSDEELEPELVDEGPRGKAPEHDVKFRPAEAKKPTDDAKAPPTIAAKPAATKPADTPQDANKSQAHPSAGDAVPDEDADFTFKPKSMDKSKPRSPSPAKKSRAPSVPSKASSKKPSDSDDELEPELIDVGPYGAKPSRDIMLKKPMDDAREAATPAYKPSGRKPDETPHETKRPVAQPKAGHAVPDEDADFTFEPKPMAKTKPRSPSPAKKPSAAPTETKKPNDNANAPPAAAPKPGAKAGETPRDAQNRAEPGHVVPDEDADFTVQPKPVDKTKPRSPSPAKKPSAAPAEGKKPTDDAKAPPAAATKPGAKAGETPRDAQNRAEPGHVVPDEDADFTFQPKPVDKTKPRSPSPAKKPSAAPAEIKKPTDDAKAPATAGSKPNEFPQGDKAKAPPQPGGVIPDEDADFSFKPKPADKMKPRSPSPAKKPTTTGGLPKPTDQVPTGTDEELEPELLEGPTGKKPVHEVKYKPADGTKPAETEKPVLKPVPKPVSVAKEPAKAAPSEKPKENETPSVLDKLPEKRTKTPLEKLEKPGDIPKQVDAKKPAEVEKPAEPKKTGGLVKEIGPDGKTRWVKPTPEPQPEAKKPADDARAPTKAAPGTAPKPSANPADASKGEPQKAPLKALPGDAVPDEDADFTLKPKQAEKTKPRSPSPAKKPTAAATKPAKPQDAAKPESTKAPIKAQPGAGVPDEDTDFTFKPKPADKPKHASGKPTGTDEELEPDLLDGPGQKPPHDVKFKPTEAKKPVEDAKHAPKPAPRPVAAKPGETAKAPSQPKPGAAVPDEDADFTFMPKPKAASKKPVGSDEEMEPDLLDGPSGQKPPHDVKFKPSDAKKPAEEAKMAPKAAAKPIKPVEGARDEPMKPEEAAEPKITGGLVKELGPDGKVRWVKPTPDQNDEPAKTDDKPAKPADAAKKAPAKPRDASAEPKMAPKAASKPSAQPAAGAKEPAKAPLKLKPGEPDNDQDADATLPLKPASAKPAVAAPGKHPAKQDADKPKDAAKPAAQKPRDSSTDPKAAPKAAPKPAAKPATAAKEPLKPKPGEPTTDQNADATFPLKPSSDKPAAATAKPATAPKAAAKPGEAPKPPSTEAPKAATKPGDAAKAAPKPAEAPKAKAGEPQKVQPKPSEEPKAASKPGEAPKAQPAAAPKAGTKPGEAPKAATKPAEAPKAAAAKPGEALKPTAKPGETPKTQPAAVPKAAAKPADAPKPALKPVVAPTAAGPANEDGPKNEEEKPSVLDKLPERGKKTPLEKYVPFKPPEEKPSVLDSLPEKMQKTPLEKYIPLGGPEAAKPDGKPKYDPLKYLPEKNLEAVPKKTGGLIKEIGPDGKVKWVKPPPEPKPEPPPKKAAPRKVTVIPEEPVEDVDAEANLPLGKKPTGKDKEAKPDNKGDPKKGTKRKPGDDKGEEDDEEPQKSDEDLDDEEDESSDEDMEVDGAKPKKGKKKAKKPKKSGDDESDDDESDEDEESDADDSDGPHKKKAKKKPKKGKKSKKKGDNEDTEPSDEDADYTFKPKRKKKKPADEDGSDDDEDRPSKRRKKRKLKKKKPKKEKKEKAPKEPPPKRRWVPPPRQVEEVVAPPPDEKRLCDILREEKINPIKHYAKKPNHIETAIPFVIPWEQSAALVTQEGMGAFGTPRHNAIHIDDGHVELKQGALKSDTVLPLWEDHYRHSETQKGMTSFGSHKKNVGNVIDHHKYESDTKLNLCEGVIPRHALGSLATQQDMTPIGALRTQKMNVKYKENMTEGFDKKGNAFLSRQMQPNSTEHAGSHIMDRRRGIVPATEGKEIKMTHERASDGIIPLLFTTDFIDKRSGADFGSFRPTVHEDEGGYPLSYDEEMRCKAVIPFQTAPGLVNGRY